MKCYIFIYIRDYDIYDVIKEYRNYYEEQKVNNIIENFKNHHNAENIKFENIFNLITDFKEYFKNQKIQIKKSDFEKYYYKKKLENFIDENDYDDLIIQFDNLDYKIKNDLSKKIKFNEKYNREIYLELCQLLSYQIDKVTTSSFEILNKDDIELTINKIKKILIIILRNYQKIAKINFYVIKKLN